MCLIRLLEHHSLLLLHHRHLILLCLLLLHEDLALSLKLLSLCLCTLPFCSYLSACFASSALLLDLLLLLLPQYPLLLVGLVKC